MENWNETLLSQFVNSRVINSIISSFNAALDPSANIDAFLEYIWNVNTAVGNGLDIWGRIVGVSRNIASVTTGQITLADADFRTLILVKSAANIGNVTVPTLNGLLSQIFSGYGDVYVQDNLNMTLTYVFDFEPTTAQQSIVENSGVMPRPAGVEVIYQWPTVSGPLFGFDSDNSYIAGFDTGSWATE